MDATFSKMRDSMTRWQHFALNGNRAYALICFQQEEDTIGMTNKEIYEEIDAYIERYNEMVSKEFQKVGA